MDQVFEHRLRLLLFWCVTPLLAIMTAFGLTARNLKHAEYSPSKQRQDDVKLERWAQKNCGEDYLRYRQVAAMYDVSGNAGAYKQHPGIRNNATEEEILHSATLWFWPTASDGAPLLLGPPDAPQNTLRFEDIGYSPALSAVIRKPEWHTYFPEFLPIERPITRWTEYYSDQFGYPLYPMCLTGEDPEEQRLRIQAAAFDQALLVPIRHFMIAQQAQPATMAEAMSRFDLAPITGRLQQMHQAGFRGVYRDSTQSVYGVMHHVDGKEHLSYYQLHDIGYWSPSDVAPPGDASFYRGRGTVSRDEMTLWWDGTEASLGIASVPPPAMPNDS